MFVGPIKYSVQTTLQIYKIIATLNQCVKFNIISKKNASSRPIVMKYICEAINVQQKQLESGPMPNVMAALPNIGVALCSTPQFG